MPNPNREVHPSIADIVPGVTVLHGSAPQFQYAEPTPEWNHGEGFAPTGTPDADYGGWHTVDDGLHVTSADVHTTQNWTSWTWENPVHPAAPHQMLRFVGYLRPAGLGREHEHPLYGDLSQSTFGGPFNDRTYVDQGAFEMFRPIVPPSTGQMIVIVIQCWESVGFQADASDRALEWTQVYQGFFSPDGLVRREREGMPRTPDTFFTNDDDADVVRPHQNLIATWNPAAGYWPIVAYPVLSATGRQTTLNEQRYLQLVQAIKCILRETDLRNPLHYEPLTPQDIADRVVVFCTGDSNGGLAGQWLTLRFPHLIDGFFAQVIPPAYQRLYGEQDLGFAINHLSGSQVLDGIGEADYLIWNQYAWSRGHEIYDLSYLRHFLSGNTYRPGAFLPGDEDLTTNGAEWVRVLSGAGWAPAGVEPSPSTFGSPLYHRLAWAVAEKCGHTGYVEPVIDPYAGGSTVHGRDLAHATIEQAIGQKQVQPFVPPFPAVPHEPHRGDGNLRGLDDPHEWALGRLGEPPQAPAPPDPLLRDTAFFDASQPGAAGTRLGFRESMVIDDHKVYVAGAEGIVSAFEVDLTHPKRPLRRIAQSPPLGHGAYAMAIVGSGAQTSLVVGTRRHLHLVGLATPGSAVLPVLQAVQLPWEVAQPHALKVADVLASNPGPEIVFASKHGGLVFYSTSLVPLYEWPEPGIVDFSVQGSGSSATVTILSARGMLATVAFDGMNHATLVAASQPLPRRLTQYVAPASYDPWLDSPTQGRPHDLEMMMVNLGPFGIIPGFVTAWTGDEDCTDSLALRLFNPATLDRVPLLIGGIQNLTISGGRGGIDLATCRESWTGPVGDHLLVLFNDHLVLFDQGGGEVGRKALRIHGPPYAGTGPRPPYHYPFGEQAHSIVVGELVTNSAPTYREEVVIATQSGSLMWMHIDEVANGGIELPEQHDPVQNTWLDGYWVEVRRTLPAGVGETDVQPHTNMSLSATWGMTMVPGDTSHLHVLDQRGGHWTVDAAGNVELYERGWMSGSKGWGYVGAVLPPPPGNLVGEFLSFPLVPQPYLAYVDTRPWQPINPFTVGFETEAKYEANNWTRANWLSRTVFGDFAVHQAGGGVVLGDATSPSEVWSWSPGNLLEGFRVQPGGVLDGIWASTRWPATISTIGGQEVGDLVKYRDLRHGEESTHAAEQQALVPVRLQSGQTVLVLGCPGGRVRVVQPGAWREDSAAGTHHDLGTGDDGAVDHGFGGCALAVRPEDTGSGERLRIFFGTLEEPAKRPSLYASTSGNVQLLDDEVVCGGIHEYTWDASSGLVGPLRSSRLEPTTAMPRGGYGVVGLAVADLLPDPGDELIAGTLAGDIFIFCAEPSGQFVELWRTHVPGAVGFYNSIVVADLDSDGRKELYVAGSFGLWRFVRPEV